MSRFCTKKFFKNFTCFTDHYFEPCTAMLVFDDKQLWHVTLFLPDSKSNSTNEDKLGEYFRSFRDLAVKHERSGNGRDSIFIISETDNPDNFRIVSAYSYTFFFQNLSTRFFFKYIFMPFRTSCRFSRITVKMPTLYRKSRALSNGISDVGVQRGHFLTVIRESHFGQKRFFLKWTFL